jgi:hypothetical protein
VTILEERTLGRHPDPPWVPVRAPKLLLECLPCRPRFGSLLSPKAQFLQSFRIPTTGYQLTRWFRYHEYATNPKEGSSTLSRYRGSGKTARHHPVERPTERPPSRHFRPLADDGYPVAQTEVPNCFIDEF